MGAIIEPKLSMEEFLGDFNLQNWNSLSDLFPEIIHSLIL